MRFFNLEEFTKRYPSLGAVQIEEWQLEASCEIIFSQIGLRYRSEWNDKNVPLAIKEASMEQLRFMLEHDIPFLDIDKKLKAGSMEAELKTDYSTLALRILANHGYLYRGSPINYNMGLNIPFGG